MSRVCSNPTWGGPLATASLNVFADLLRGPPLIGRFLFTRTEDELHWVQRWVEVHPQCIATFVKEGEPPCRVVMLTDVEVSDELDRHFSLRWLPPSHAVSGAAAMEASVMFRTVTGGSTAEVVLHRDVPLVTVRCDAVRSSSSSSCGVDNDDEDVSTVHFRTCEDTTATGTSPTGGGVKGTWTAPVGATAESDNAATSDEADCESDGCPPVVFRCCDRIECVDMLRFVRMAWHMSRRNDAATQVDESAFGFCVVTAAVWEANASALQSATLECARLRDELTECSSRCAAEVKSCNLVISDLETRLKTKDQECRRKMEALQRKCAAEKFDAVAEAEKRSEGRIAFFQSRMDDIQAQLLAASSAAQSEREALRRQVLEYQRKYHQLLQQRKQSRDMERAAMHNSQISEAARLFARLRSDHLSWLRHHYAAEQIARFSLALKRAGQILKPIHGAAQFAVEFQHDWPIVARLIELPLMIREEDAAWEHLAALLHVQLEKDPQSTANDRLVAVHPCCSPFSSSSRDGDVHHEVASLPLHTCSRRLCCICNHRDETTCLHRVSPSRTPLSVSREGSLPQGSTSVPSSPPTARRTPKSPVPCFHRRGDSSLKVLLRSPEHLALDESG